MSVDNGVESFLNDEPPEWYNDWLDYFDDNDFEEAQGADGHLYRYLKDSPYYRVTHSDNCACYTDPERFW